MEQEKIFILKNKRTFKRSVNIYVFDQHGRIDKRNIIFTTEHLVAKEQRGDMAKIVAAQYFAKNEAEIKALMSNSGYGATFVRIDDLEGKLKLPVAFVSPEDAEKAALKLNFDSIGLDFNAGYPLNVLKIQYEQHIHALAGVNKLTSSPAKEIPATPINYEKDRNDVIVSAKAKFEEIYGYPVPEIVANDIAFIDGLSNPDFDPKAYIQSKQAEVDKADSKAGTESDNNEGKDGGGSTESVETIENLRQRYFDEKHENVPNVKKNDAAWIKSKLK